MAETGTLSRKQSKAIAALLSSRCVAEAAETARVGTRTLWRWLSDPTFREALSRAQSEALGIVTARLTALLGKSLDVLAADLDGDDAARASRAALGILSRFADLAEFADLADRVDRLERLVEKK